METNALGYAIGRVLSQLTTKKGLAGQVAYKTNNLNPPSEIGQCYFVVYFSWKMIPFKTYYKIYDQELLAIIEAFKSLAPQLEKM